MTTVKLIKPAASASPTAATEDPLISFSKVEKTFTVQRRELDVVRDINLTIEEGEFITILGPSGCGKSTLLNMIAGILQPTHGQVHYRGRPVRGLNLRTGYMTQTDHLLPWRTTARNIRVPLEISGLSRVEADAKVQELLKLVGLEGFGDAYASQISGGMRKRVVLARLLAQNPETLLMDEPFVALDAQMRVSMQTELRRLCKVLRKTVLFVTHDVDEAVALGDRCVVFTARPGTIQTIVPIPLSSERDLTLLRGDPDYTKTCARLWELMTPHLKRTGI